MIFNENNELFEWKKFDLNFEGKIEKGCGNGKFIDSQNNIIFEGYFKDMNEYTGKGKIFDENNNLIWDGEMKDSYFWDGNALNINIILNPKKLDKPFYYEGKKIYFSFSFYFVKQVNLKMEYQKEKEKDTKNQKEKII